MNLTKGLGAGAKHNIGQAADESIGEIVNYIQGSNMVLLQLVWEVEQERELLTL